MNKKLLINSGGALAVALLVFGSGLLLIGSRQSANSTAAQNSATPEAETAKPASEHATDSGESKSASPKEDARKEIEIKQDPAEVSAELKQFELKFNDLFSRGEFEEARSIAVKAGALSHRDDPMWLRRIADSTYLSDVLPLNLRSQKALEMYSALIASSASGIDKHWAQYRVCLCLRHLGRWEDALQAINLFAAAYPESERIPELRLYRAQAFSALGHLDEAQQEIEKIIKTSASRDVHASALVELAQMNVERSKKTDSRAGPGAAAEVIDLTRYPVAPADEAPARGQSAQSVDIPDEQWGSIRRCVEKGNIKEAQRLLNPWIESESTLSVEHRARVAIKFAHLLNELSQGNSPEVSK